MRRLPVLAALAVASAAGAETPDAPLGAGDPLPTLELEDQHGEAGRLDASAALVLFSRDMEGGGVIKEALARDGAAFLERNGGVYVADVSRMPGIVRSLMAKPAMRRRPYRMLLDEDGGPTAAFPTRSGHATLLFVDAGQIARVEFVASPAALRAAVESEPEAED